MIKYLKPTIDHSDQIAKIHLKTFPDFFLTTLGYSFLKTYYKSCINSSETVSICAFDDETNTLLGFSVGCLNSKGFNKRLIYANLGMYTYLTLILLFTKPIALVRLLKNFTKGGELKDKGNYAELLSIGVIPNKNGLGIGQKLLIEFENRVKQNRVKTITLTTDVNSNDNVLKFYKKSGYKIYCEFIAYPKRKMFKLIKEI